MPRGTWKSDKYSLKQLRIGDVVTVESKNFSFYSFLANRGDVLGMTFKGNRLGGGKWRVTRVE